MNITYISYAEKEGCVLMDRSVDLATELIMKYEGFKAKAYKCPAGVWTIGYGRTSAVGAKVTSTSVTTKEAERRWLAAFVGDLCSYVTLKALPPEIGLSLRDHQIAALVSFIYNVGKGAFMGSGVRRFLLVGDEEKALARWKMWNKSGGVILGGLVRRRNEEISMWEGTHLSLRCDSESLPRPF